MKGLGIAVGLLVPLCSCCPIRGSLAPCVSFGLEGLRDDLVVDSGIWLTAIRMCTRSQAELLASPGEAFCFDANYPCDSIANTLAARQFCVVGLEKDESGTVLAPGVGDVELFSGCNQTKQMLPELGSDPGPGDHLYVYLARREDVLSNPLVRVGFRAAVQSPGSISIVCESAELASWDDVPFTQLPPTRS